MPYTSPLSIDLPTNLTIWQWLFTSPTAPINTLPPSQVRGYINATTDFRLAFPSVRTYATHVSTALTRVYSHRPGASTAIFASNGVWWPVAMFASLRIGGTISGASPSYGVDEMAYALRTARAEFLWTLPEALDVAVLAAEKAGLDRGKVFLLEGEREGFLGLGQLAEMGRAFGHGEGGGTGQTPEWCVPEGKVNGDVTAFLSFSSGTTGLPKAVMISHQNMIAQCLQVQQLTTPGLNKVLAALPFFHITGLVHILHLPVFINADVIMLPKYSLPGLLDVITRYRLPEALLVPPILIQLTRSPLALSPQYDLSSVRTWWTGAAPLPQEIIHQLAQRFPGAGIKQGYGMTETCSCLTITPHGDVGYGPAAATVGRPVPATSIKIVDPADHDVELAPGQPGEIVARGPQIVRGYLANAEATAAFWGKGGWTHGWARTGDLGVMDQSGRVTVTDRIKEMVKVNGVPVAPAELEDCLLEHPQVEDVAVVGVAHDTKGEVPRAFVKVKESGTNGELEELRESVVKWVQERKAKIKWLEGGVQFVDAVPKSPSGKILRRLLRDGARAEQEPAGVQAKAKL